MISRREIESCNNSERTLVPNSSETADKQLILAFRWCVSDIERWWRHIFSKSVNNKHYLVSDFIMA